MAAILFFTFYHHKKERESISTGLGCFIRSINTKI